MEFATFNEGDIVVLLSEYISMPQSDGYHARTYPKGQRCRIKRVEPTRIVLSPISHYHRDELIIEEDIHVNNYPFKKLIQ